MKPILVLYATREGQTRKVADYIGAKLENLGFDVDVLNAAYITPACDLNTYETAVLAASIHVGGHEPEIVKFAKAHRDQLMCMHASLLSVSGSQIGVEIPSATTEMRERCTADVRMMTDKFIKETDWQPYRVFPVAGALMYRKYNFLVRWVMRNIAKKNGGSTDTSRNIEYTDWSRLDSFVDELVAEIGLPTELSVAA